MPAGGRGDMSELLSRSSWWIISLAGLLAVFAWLIFRIRARYREDEGVAESEHQFLSQIGEMHREGRLSETEYRSIKGRLVARLDDAPSAPPDEDSHPSGTQRTAQQASGRRDANTEQ